ncbi:MAG: diaminopimelate epimerase [Gemmatimonadetes bacterium]|nr:diaminopimelate epimerase [Gemmatimonadota bacterium]
MSAGARFLKGEALGNDYVVFEAGTAWKVTPPAVRLLCERNRGIGADGIIVPVPAADADHAIRIFNPDGSEAERSGNGLRIFAVACLEGVAPARRAAGSGSRRTGPRPMRAAGPPSDFTVEVGGDTIPIHVHGRAPDGTWDISVEMGIVSFEDRDVGLDRDRFEHDLAVRRLLSGDTGSAQPTGTQREGTRSIVMCPVSVGNPHCVLLGPSWDEEQLWHIGPALSTHPAFARGINVQLAWHAGGRRLRALVWERGAGETSASGSSACAVAAAAVREGILDAGAVEVEMAGGTLEVEVASDFALTLRGPARAVYRGELVSPSGG